MAAFFRALLIVELAMFSSLSFAQESGSCGFVKVDCKTHEITIGSQPPRKIDCGKDHTTISGTGTVGGNHSGDVVKDGVEILTPEMGPCGGGKVFHMPTGGGDPQGLDDSKGCVHVDKQTLDELHQCKGSKLQIIGTDGGDPQRISPACTAPKGGDTGGASNGGGGGGTGANH